MPTVLLDYAFVSKAEDQQSLTILVTKDRDSRLVIADVVPSKGTVEDTSAERAAENVLRLGNRGRLIVNTDNEPALLALREAVVQRLATTSIPEAPPPR